MAVINTGNIGALCMRLCVDVQANIDARRDSPINNEDNANALINFLVSDANNSNNIVTEAVGQLAGKAVPVDAGESNTPATRVNLIWTTPECGETDDCETPGNICSLSGSYTEKRKYAEFVIGERLCETGVVNITDFMNICSNPTAFMDDVQRAARRMKRGLNRKAWEAVAANLSDYANGVDSATNPRTLPVITIDSNGQAMPNSAGIIMARSEYRQKSWEGGFNVFGGNAVAQYQDLLEMRGQARSPFIYDNKLDPTFDDVFDPNTLEYNMVTIPTGIFNFVPFWRNDIYMQNPELMAMSPSYTRTKMTIDGITYDFDLYMEPCATKLVWRLSIDFDFFKIPDTEYCAGTGGLMLRWLADCGDATCDLFFPPAPDDGDEDPDPDPNPDQQG